MKTFDFAVYIGRFQPVHLGHLHVVREGLKQAKQIIILAGSAHQPVSTRNPWTIEERESMFRGAFNQDENRRIHILPLMDNLYNDETWVRNVQSSVSGLVAAHHSTPHKPAQIALIGHSKDHSSYYLNLFPQWSSINVDNYQSICATPIREALFDKSDSASQAQQFLTSARARKFLSANVIEALHSYISGENFAHLQEEHEFVQNYKKAWSEAPYAPTFVTVDAVVVQSGHILLVERRARPGKGLLALPGGFIKTHEKLLDACLRELREETRLKVPLPVLKGSVKTSRLFDDPYRSERGRTLTQAFYLELTPNSELPKVKGSDDARHAMWVPLSELEPGNLFEDHYFIIQELIGM